MARNALINGNFDVWQRGTSYNSGLLGPLYLADRWRMIGGGTLPGITVSRQQLAAGDIPGAYYHMRIAPDAAGNPNDFRVEQRIEYGTRYLCGAGKKVTMSFWARSNIAGKRIGVSLFQIYGSGGSAQDTISGANWQLTSSWARYSFTFDTATLAGKTVNEDFLSAVFYVAWNAANAPLVGSAVAETFRGAGNIDIAQVQLCAGDVALPYMPRSFAEELALCQRYTQAFADSASFTSIGQGFAVSGTSVAIQVPLLAQMRITPSLVATASDWQAQDGSIFLDVTALAIDASISSKQAVTLSCTVTGATVNRPYRLLADGTANRLLILDAEL